MPPVIDWLVSILGLVFAGVAMVGMLDAARHSNEAFAFVGKIPRWGWMAILTIAAIFIFLRPVSLLGLAGLAATGIYFFDTRPKIKEATNA